MTNRPINCTYIFPIEKDNHRFVYIDCLLSKQAYETFMDLYIYMCYSEDLMQDSNHLTTLMILKGRRNTREMNVKKKKKQEMQEENEWTGRPSLISTSDIYKLGQGFSISGPTMFFVRPAYIFFKYRVTLYKNRKNRLNRLLLILS